MKRYIRILLAAVLCMPLTLCQPAMASYHEVVAVDEVVSVYDGDTVRVNIDHWPAIIGHNMPIRLRGIDTPEIRGVGCPSEKERGLEARDLVRKLVGTATQIEIRELSRGKYFRVIAELWIDGESVGDALIQQGLAREYHGGTRMSWCPTQSGEVPTQKL